MGNPSSSAVEVQDDNNIIAVEAGDGENNSDPLG